MIALRRKKMNAINLLCFVGLTSVFSYGFNMGILGERPEVPFEATTLEQDALLEASAMLGDNREESSVAACDALIADETLPFELRCWAVRQKIRLCAYACREWEALEAGRKWLQEHGDEDYDPGAIRVTLGGIIAYRGHANFVPLGADAKEIFDELISNQPTDDLDKVKLHEDYSRLLRKLKRTNPALHQRAAEQMGKAVSILENIIEQDELVTKELHKQVVKRGRSSVNKVSDDMLESEEWRERFRTQLQNELTSLQKDYDRLRSIPGPAAAQITEEEYVSRKKRFAEGVRLVRQQRIEQGIDDPDSMEYTSQEVFEALKKAEKEKNQNTQ